MRRWQRNSVVPVPVVLVKQGNYFVYLREEIDAIASVLARHESEYAYLCETHTDTVAAIDLATRRARQQEGVATWQHQ